MHWLLIAIIIVALLAASTVSLRWGLGLLAAIVVAAVALYFISGGGWRPSADRAVTVAVSDVNATPAYAGSWSITARVENRSDKATVKDLLLKISPRSCPSSTTPVDDCVTLSAVEQRVRAEIPPSANRNVNFTVTPQAFFDDLENPRWHIEAIEVRTR